MGTCDVCDMYVHSYHVKTFLSASFFSSSSVIYFLLQTNIHIMHSHMQKLHAHTYIRICMDIYELYNINV